MITDPHIKKLLKISGVEVPIWFYGHSKNPALLFIHGRLRSFSDYVGDLPPRYLSKNFYICAFDLPNFGKSKELHMPPEEFVSKVVHKFFPNQRVVLFGTSYGGIVSMNLTLKYPELVRGLIITASPIFFSLLNSVYLLLYLPRVSKKLSFLKEFKTINKAHLKQIRVPSLLFYGPNDRLAPLYMGKKLKRILPHSKLFVVRNRSHSWFLHRIDETGILREINTFMSSLPKS